MVYIPQSRTKNLATDLGQPKGLGRYIAIILMVFLLKRKMLYFLRLIKAYGFLLVDYSLILIGQQGLRDCVNHQNLFSHWQESLQIVRQPRRKVAYSMQPNAAASNLPEMIFCHWVTSIRLVIS